MRDNYTSLYVHLVWTTWDRLPFLTPEREARIYGVIQQECVDARSEVVAIGGIEDHVHVLATLPTTLCVSDFVKQLKGTSSHFANHGLRMNGVFRWQGSYAAFSVSANAVPNVRDYIVRQKEHHASGTIDKEMEIPF